MNSIEIEINFHESVGTQQSWASNIFILSNFVKKSEENWVQTYQKNKFIQGHI